MADIVSTKERVAIIAGARTPIGSFGKAFRETEAHELGSAAVREALIRSGISPDEVGEVIMGNIGQVGSDAYNARRVSLGAGLHTRVPAYTVNRLCGSGLQAIWSGAQQLLWGGVDVVVAGGDENMTRLPFYDYNARFNDRLGDRTLVDGTLQMLSDPFTGKHMGTTAENVSERFNVTREDQDAFAVESQRRAALPAAQEAFAEEIVPVVTSGRKPVTISADEHPKPGTTHETLAGLRPAFKEGGSVTAGNSSGINDGAAAVVLMRESDARARGLTALATIEAVTTAGIEPEIMGYAPTLAVNKLFAETGFSAADIGHTEMNEAFAAQALAVIRDTGLDPERTNPFGGAIALGHPVGATGAILTLRAAMNFQRHEHDLALISMCIGGGQALAALLRRWED